MSVFATAAYPQNDRDPKVAITPRSMPPSHASSTTRPNLRMDVNMVQIPVTVTDPWDRPVMNLESDSFRLLEDDVEQKIVSLHKEDGPLTVGFILDASSSMKKRMAPSKAAIELFFKTTEPGDEFSLIRFSDKPTLVTGLTGESQEILDDLPFVQAEGWTALLDAICFGVQQLKGAKNKRKALFVLSDGGDNSSRYTESEVRSLVRESDLQLYAVGLFERPGFLAKLAADTGGEALWVHTLKGLPEAIERISRSMRDHYVLGYSSNNPRTDGKYRRIKIQLIPSLLRNPLNVVWRRGYYAPAE
jgi:Ca-activated chloride channel homolog